MNDNHNNNDNNEDLPNGNGFTPEYMYKRNLCYSNQCVMLCVLIQNKQYTHIHAHMCIHTYIFIYIYIYICTHMYIYIHIQSVMNDNHR